MENSVYDAILARRSIRRFKETPVSREQIRILLQAAMAAPSACNLQPWAFVVVDDPEQLVQLKACTSQGQYNAPLAIVVCGIRNHIPWDGDGWLLDCGAAAQNIMLASVDMKLGSVCIGGFDEDALCSLLEIPPEVKPVCIIEIGYPASEKPSLTWYTEEAVHWQKYDAGKPRTMRTLQMLQDDIDAGII